MTDSPVKIESLADSADLLVIGAGVVGLWCALTAAEKGLRVAVLEAGRAGKGASNGHLGALMPHQPVNWSAKKQDQLEGLMELETQVAILEAETGLSCGYRRSGRVVPLTSEAERARHEDWARDAARHWPALSPSGLPLTWQVTDANPAPGWLAEETGPFGFSFDTLSARISPRLMTAALSARLGQLGVFLHEGQAVREVLASGEVELADSEVLHPRRVILAAGWQSFSMMPGHAAMVKGSGVKGQSALLKPRQPVDPALPVLYGDGAYAIAHDDGLVAVGSTSEKEWNDPHSTDMKLDAVIAAATRLSPALQGAAVIDRWAGVRPKGPTAAPVVGPVEGAPSVILATGGFKITFALAHRMARSAVAFAME